MSLGWVLDPAEKDCGSPLDLNDDATYRVTGIEMPFPPIAAQTVGSADKHGESLYSSKYGNRTITLKLLVRGATDAGLADALTALQQKLGKINADAPANRRNGVGGILKHTKADGDIRYFEVQQAATDIDFAKTFTARKFIEGSVVFTCLPLWLGEEVALSDHVETTLPTCTFTEAVIEGDAPGLLRLVVDEDQGADQPWALAALRARHRTSALTDRLFYQAESLTMQGAGASSSTAASGYSGSGAVRATSLSTSPESIISTQMTTAALTSVTGSNTTDIFTKSSHGLTNDTRVRLSSLSGGSNLSTTTDYYVVNASTGFQLATTMGGTPVDLGSDVSSVTVTPQTHLSHVGAYRVFARVQAPFANTGIVGVALEWGAGDFRRPTRNSTVYLTGSRLSTGTALEADWLLVDLGLIRIPDGATRWEGRVLAWSTVLNDDVYVDYLWLPPADEGYGVAMASAVSAAATSYSARSDFSGESGSPVGDALNAGGNWAVMGTAYESDDFNATGGALTRSTGGADASTDIRYGRWIYANGAQFTDVAVQVWCGVGAPGSYSGVVARAVDRDTFLTAYVWNVGPSFGSYLAVSIEAWTGSGAHVNLGSGALPNVPVNDTYCKIRLVAYASGRWELYSTSVYVDSWQLVTSGSYSGLATGGVLASGYNGIIDWSPGTAYGTARSYDDFYVWVPVSDAACFANQSLQFASNGVTREDTSGTYWLDVSSYEGRFLEMPASGREGRTTEFTVKMCRNNPYTGADNNIDDLSVKPYVTPRGLVV